MRKLILSMLLMAALAATMPLSAARKKKAAASSPGFSYYLLALSWAPDFCAQAGTNGNPAECGTGEKKRGAQHTADRPAGRAAGGGEGRAVWACWPAGGGERVRAPPQRGAQGNGQETTKPIFFP